ncbi:MAG TPA: adenylate/guanylate cyclase domain-containing protein [bacterium]|nr:adenylate/guanylate cyclase domain-containing protein [bacterium]
MENTALSPQESVITKNVFVVLSDVANFTLRHSSDEQREIVESLKKIVKKESLIVNKEFLFLRLTGDGFLLIVDADNPQSKIKKIISFVSNVYENMKKKGIDLRFGINYGSVFEVDDFGENCKNYIGTPINDAARILSVSGNDHILFHDNFHKSYSDLIRNKDDQSAISLGEVLVKHNKNIEIFNFAIKSKNIGSTNIPKKVQKINIIKTSIVDALGVITKEINNIFDKFGKKGVDKEKARVRASIILHNSYEKLYYVSILRYQYPRGILKDKSKIVFREDNNPVHKCFSGGKSDYFYIPYDYPTDSTKYVAHWRKHFKDIPADTIKNFNRPSRIYLYVPIIISNPTLIKNMSERQILGVLCIDSEIPIPGWDVKEAMKKLLDTIQDRTQEIGFLLANLV